MDGSPGGVALAGHLTMIEACLVLGVSAATVLEWTRAGTIPCTQTRAHGLVVPAWAVVQVLLSTSGPG
ncbi:helix-turn-helix domain-containing protein [Solicola sp. PLA-1-18]|uniref:helix-turn-helix domain-containing protein n=1 Tax=Solicola sp. PLA-1-18 TaxID=3380532 RepID=UPI003B75FB4A